MKIHARDEELHPLLEVAAEHPRGSWRNPVAAFDQPRLQSLALLGREDEDVVFPHRVLRLDPDPQALGAGGATDVAHGLEVLPSRSRHRCRISGLTGIFIEVLQQAGGGIGVEVVEQGLLGDMDLLLLQEGRDRDDDGELLRIAFEVVRHGEDRAVAVASQYYLRGLVEQAGVRLGDVEAAEAESCTGGRRQGGKGEEGDQQAFHPKLLSSRRDGPGSRTVPVFRGQVCDFPGSSRSISGTTGARKASASRRPLGR